MSVVCPTVRRCSDANNERRGRAATRQSDSSPSKRLHHVVINTDRKTAPFIFTSYLVLLPLEWEGCILPVRKVRVNSYPSIFGIMISTMARSNVLVIHRVQEPPRRLPPGTAHIRYAQDITHQLTRYYYRPQQQSMLNIKHPIIGNK